MKSICQNWRMFSFWGRQYDSSGYIEGVRKNRVSGLTGTGLYEMMRNLLDKDGKCLKRWRSVIIAPTCYTCVHSITKGVVA